MAVDARPSGNQRLDMENLRAQWSYATTTRERIELEGKMWDSVPREARKEYENARHWAKKVFGYTLYDAEMRWIMRTAATFAGPLWERVEGPERMLLRSAAEIVRRTRLRAVSESVSLDEALLRELREYDSWTMVQTPEGSFRKKPQRPRGFGAPPAHGKQRPTENRVRRGAARELWQAVRASLKRVVDVELDRIQDARMRELLRSQAEAEVQGMLDLLQSRIRTAKNSASLNGMPAAPVDVSRKALRAACQLLSVDAPGVGVPIGHAGYLAAKKNFKRLAREYHPDLSGIGKNDPQYEQITARYRDVVEAMQTIEKSYQNASATPNTNRNGDERHDDSDK